MAVVGAYVRVNPAAAKAVRDRLDALPGVTTVAMEDPGKVGLVIESGDIDAAHRLLTGAIRGEEGVQGVWPVFVDYEDDLDAANAAIQAPA